MDLGAYIRARRERIGEESKLVRDFSVFDFGHVPERPVMRDEASVLIDAMLRYEVSGIPRHLAIVGSRGSGKTLTVKLIQRLMRVGGHELDVLYANCRTHNTSFKILAHLLDVPARGASLTELFERFRARQRRRTVVVLDEVDLMSAKDRRREILYLLSRSDPPYMIVMLSNHPHVVRDLDAATRSSLQPEQVHFRNYDAGQLKQILLDRARRGLHRWDQRQLAHIAALATRKTNADARVAIKTLFYAVTEPGSDVAACFERARRDIVEDVIRDLSDANLLILRAAAGSESGFVKEVYRVYRTLSQRHGEQPFSYVYFYANLGYLQSVGLAALMSTKVGRTYTNRIELTFDPGTLESIRKLRGL